MRKAGARNPKPKPTARVDRSWYCMPCRKMNTTRIVNDIPVCSKCKTPIERHLAEDPRAEAPR